MPDERRDEAFAFQAQLEVGIKGRFVPRPDLRSLDSEGWDERVADLQFRNDRDCAVGHNIATETDFKDGEYATVRTCWIPPGEVELGVAQRPFAESNWAWML